MILATLALTTSLLASPTADDAKALWGRVVKRYASLSNYHDTGSEESYFHARTSIQEFKTYFVRPNHWRFEYLEPQEGDAVAKHVLWANGGVAKLWSNPPGEVNKGPNTRLAFGALAMIAGDCAKAIPSLLDPKAANETILAKLTKRTLLPEANFQSTPCYRIQGDFQASARYTIWIDKKRLLILKVEDISLIPEFKGAKSTRIYRPVINLKIDPKVFNFVPPRGK